ncbi:hypothetical protein RDWZM_002484 [Blomia tropicalis]|uniref:Cysteine dioxygenase n=1 Tax=Blomia tropicalis TaxID=40697 RepID=A0A9Q0MED1_BLOTA|nr:Cysteine dioxygenase [Blomia tropicalis]KAJ6223939.1 hypothetical protein RDWZM_002484 [Blomia tropicalis]
MISHPKSFEDLIRQLREMFNSEEVDIEQVKSLMASYQTNPSDWAKFVHFDKFRYTRNLVDAGNGKYNLMILCWPQKIQSQIHDHSDAHCIMRSLSGTLYEVRFRWPESNGSTRLDDLSRMEKIDETKLDSENPVAYINDSIGLHRVENRDPVQYAVTLHLYCPPFTQCNTFDEETGLNETVRMTFDNEPKKAMPTYTVRKMSSVTNMVGEITKEMLLFEQSV